MSRRVSGLTGLTSFMMLGLMLVVASGCSYGRGYYGFHWSYCRFFGYPKLLNCIAPPSAALLVLPRVPYPEENPPSTEKAELGKLLFFDKRLSSTGTVSCASCHLPDKGFADPPHRLSRGIEGREGSRNAPTVLNTAFHQFLFWDGRAKSLEEQAVGPITNDKEMGPTDNLDGAIKRLNADLGIRAQFDIAFGSPEVTATAIVKALATFERSLVLSRTAFERWVREEEPMPSWSAERGWEVFRGQGQCAICHTLPLYTDNKFHNIGIRRHQADGPDSGRYARVRNQADRDGPVAPPEAESMRCAFKTPSLINAAVTPPYMHNGTLVTLENVVSFYARFDPRADYARSDSQADDPECGKPDPILEQLRGRLTPEEQMDLVEFLRSLKTSSDVYREFLTRLELPTGQQAAAITAPNR